MADVIFIIILIGALFAFGWHYWPYVLAVWLIGNFLYLFYERWQEHGMEKYREKIERMARGEE